MPPPSQSSGTQSSVSPPTRDNYTSSASQIPRYGFENHRMPEFTTNPSQSSFQGASRSFDGSSFSNMSSSASVSAYGPSNTSPGDAASHFPTISSQNSVPPFDSTKAKSGYGITDANGGSVRVEINAKIDKGFFKADQDWTCYRRNYFSVQCSYTLQPYGTKSEPLHLMRPGMSPAQIRAFAVCITAKVDGEEGKTIELVQHTPKRDKGPMGRPEKIKLFPQPSGSFGTYTEAAGGISPRSGLSAEYENAYAPTSPSQQQTQTSAMFDRIQFKNATANNGKRRAAQQYFHIVVELFAEIPNNQSSEAQWVKVASRISAPMVVRGRSPGHYSDDRRGSSTSMGPGGGSSGDSAGSQRDPHSGGPGAGRSGIAGMFSNPPRLGSGGSGNYMSHRASSNRSPSENLSDQSSTSSNYRNTAAVAYERPPESILTSEEKDHIENHDGYQYYPSTLFEAPAIPSMARPYTADLSNQHESAFSAHGASSDDVQTGLGRVMGSPVESQRYQGSHTMSGNIATRNCGRFQGFDTSRGYYPETPAL